MVEVTPGQGEIIGDSVDRRVELLAELDEVHATLSRFGPGRDGADRHVHRLHSDVFVVLEGTLTLKTDEGEDEVGPGNVVVVPSMVIHGFGNTSDADVWYVNLHMPGLGFNDYMRGLRDGVRVDFDQFDPPADRTGILDPGHILMTQSHLPVDGHSVQLHRDGTVTVGRMLRINPRPG